MRRPASLSLVVLLAMLLGLVTVPTGAQAPDRSPPGLLAPPATSYAGRVGPAEAGPPASGDSRHPASPAPADAVWHIGPVLPFEYVRHDAVFVPGPSGTSWANRVYFLGGRTSPSTELPDIWVFDPVTGIYTDTQADMDEDVSNYNTNLILDDCTSRGPAAYVIGGTDKDHGGFNIGRVQRYYPALNLAESLSSEDDWPGGVGGVAVAAMGTAVVDDLIYVYGGWETDIAPYFSAETWRFDPCAPGGARWTNLGTPLALARSYILSAAQGGKVYAIGGIYDYPAQSDLVPTDQVEMLDTHNLAAGWQLRSPMPVALAEGRGYGIESDTLGPAPLPGFLYTAGGGDWPLPSPEAMVYNIATDTWDQSFPDLNDGRADNAGAYVPLYTPDPDDGLPGLWTFGGRVNESCWPPPFGRTEYYPLPVQQTCSVLLVDDDWDQYAGQPFNGAGTSYYTSTLEALGYGYDRWDTWTQGDPALADLQGYDAVVWFTGYAYTGTITSSNEAALAAYLQGGGRLFVSSEDYLDERGRTPFADQYLGVGDFLSDTREVTLLGNAGDPIGNGLGPYTLTVPASWPGNDPTLYTDQVTPAPGSRAPFHYRDSGAQSGTDVDASRWQTVFLAWPLEGLADLNDRTDVLGWSLYWFCSAAHQPQLLLEPPEQAGSAASGSPVTYTLSLVNHLGLTDTFALEYSSVWPIVGPQFVGPVANGGVLDFAVVVTVPAGMDCGAIDAASITASAVLSPTLWDSAVLETTADPAGPGDVAGTVYDANTGMGIPGAGVSLSRAGFYTQTSADANGGYGFAGLPACAYGGAASAAHYTPATFAVSVEAGLTTTVDVTLTAGWPDLTPETVSVTLTVGEVAALTLTLANSGTAGLHFTPTEVPSDVAWLSMGAYTPFVPPGMSNALPLFLDSAGLPPDNCYTATLQFAYDDPYVGQDGLPVALCVVPGCAGVADVDFTWAPPTPTVGYVVTFSATVAGTPTAPIVYTWDWAGAVVVTTSTVVTHVFTATGTYSVTLTAANACGQATAQHPVAVLAPEWRVYLPLVLRASP